jgi:acetyltransferase-like isoleucine patch superfamily enzyme
MKKKHPVSKDFEGITKKPFPLGLIDWLKKTFYTSPYETATDLFIRVAKYTPLNCRIKAGFLRSRGMRIGTQPVIYERVCIGVPAQVRVGDYVNLSRGVFLAPGAKENETIEIGDEVMIGYDAKLLASDHRIPDDITEPMRWSGHTETGGIVVEDNVWICANAVITAGCRIGTGSVVAAGAVVTKDVEPYTIVGGIPARLIRRRTKT